MKNIEELIVDLEKFWHGHLSDDQIIASCREGMTPDEECIKIPTEWPDDHTIIGFIAYFTNIEERFWDNTLNRSPGGIYISRSPTSWKPKFDGKEWTWIIYNNDARLGRPATSIRSGRYSPCHDANAEMLMTVDELIAKNGVWEAKE